MLPIYSTALTVTKERPLARGENYVGVTDEKKNLRRLSKIAEKCLVFEFRIFFFILSYIGEDAGKGEDRHLEMAPLSPPSSLSASQWSLSALHKGEARLWLLQEV